MYPLTEINKIKDKLIQAGQTISVAESVTSGHLQAAFSLADNAACFYQGGLTVYNLGQKAKQLGVDPIKALACNCVSEEVASVLALAVAGRFLSDYGIGITGYAASVPEKGIEALFAYYAIAFHGIIIDAGKLEAKQAEALQVQLFYTDAVLKILSERLQIQV
ncbi:CinA family protein [Taibaiella soli]|uniref:Damage-inducible protein CinA n=1 Tax=Taibaiella soli TaxID=1649169 RepID=A0A2W2B4X7_9BACT|nr:CinA family protein [Taibaiella soli]PZF71279.1 damage-inducible protein CinA [Taibaiella soli]